MKLIKTFINSFLSKVEIYEASNGIKVLEILDVQTIDLIFMDIQMPLMDGLETTKKIRSFNDDIPIIGLTALLDFDDESNSKSIGMSDYLRKPISRQKIFNTLKKWINQ
jgi:CheY-like chemotaxis protein